MIYFKSAYTSISAITDSEIQSFNVLLLGFTANQLSQLKMTSSNTIQVLGTLNKWSSDQVKLIITYFIWIIQIKKMLSFN